ncbi:SRPBCC family protein [Prescottella defluvii]|uniref:SRPBCC family protein n=1 Tax=Prescottella defluvii TaxID=1323361 RepID=UPI0004F3C9E0|nr:SRPBCC family protein [Prescottella defluvii]
MPPNEVHLSREIDASPEAVWRVLTDIDHTADTLTGVSRIERVAGTGYDVGTRWRETRRMMGKEATEEMWVSEVDPPRRTVVEATSSGTAYRTTFELTGRDGRTDLTMTFSARPDNPTLFTRLMTLLFGRLGMRVTTKVMTQDLDDIAARAERP